MSQGFRSMFKLHVSNIPWTVGNAELKMYFSQFGHVESAKVIFDRNIGISREYGFVTFGNRDGYNSAASKDIHHLEGRKLTVTPALE